MKNLESYKVIIYSEFFFNFQWYIESIFYIYHDLYDKTCAIYDGRKNKHAGTA